MIAQAPALRFARPRGRRTALRASRRLDLAGALALTALAAAVVTGCATSVAPPKPRFAACALPPPLPNTDLVAVRGGYVVAASGDATGCTHALALVAAVIARLPGDAPAAAPLRLGGWSCSAYGGAEITCVRGQATLYAQYVLKRT